MKIAIDEGHGALHPTTGKYVTAGKRMVKDGIEFYEGVNNRIVGQLVIDALEDLGHEVLRVAPSWIDEPLWSRVKFVNEQKPDILISIHSDAHGNGREWSPANGIGTWISKKASSNSHKLADSLNNALICNFDGVAKNRGIKKANFAITTRTNCPAVLLELGFHTNKEEVQLMVTDEWRERIVKSIVEAVEEYQLKLK